MLVYKERLSLVILFGGKCGRYVQIREGVVIFRSHGEDDSEARFIREEGRCLVRVVMFNGVHGVPHYEAACFSSGY